MTVYMTFILELVLTLLAIDFVSGLVHWAEDTFGTSTTPVIGKWIVVPNEIHHVKPLAFTRKSWWQSSWDLALVSAVIALVAWLLGVLTWHVWLFCIIGANANQLHKYAHMPVNKVPWLIRMLQKIHLFQNARDHAQHHAGEKNTAYCVVTPFLNPLLDRLGFWRGLERLTVPIFGAPRRTDIKWNHP